MKILKFQQNGKVCEKERREEVISAPPPPRPTHHLPVFHPPRTIMYSFYHQIVIFHFHEQVDLFV